MKPKKFYEPRLKGGALAISVFFVMTICVIIYFTQRAISLFIQFETFWHAEAWGWGAFALLFLGFFVFIYVILAPESCSTIEIHQDKIVWSCFLFKKISLNFYDCHYITVESAQGNVGRDMFSERERLYMHNYICFSTEQIPDKYTYTNKISSFRCKKTFIRFAYSDELYFCLLAVLNYDQTVLLRKFYENLQAELRRIGA